MKIVTENEYAVQDSEGLILIDGEGVIIYIRGEIEFEKILRGLKSKLINFSLRNVEPSKDPDRPIG